MDTSASPPVPTQKTLSGWLGHIITLLLAGTAGGVGYGTVEARINSLEVRMDNVENQVVMELRDVKEDLGDLRVRIAEMGQDVRWLKEKSGEIGSNPRLLDYNIVWATEPTTLTKRYL